MRKSIQLTAALAAALSLTGTMSFAQSGADTYKAKCASCHGATGMAETGAGKAMKIKPANDPEVKKMTQEEMITVTTTGKGKMPAYKGKLTDDQIKAVVEYFSSLGK